MKRFIFLVLFFFISNRLLVAQETKITVLFDFNKYNIPDSSLLQIAKLISTKNIDRILLEGHCDSLGSKAYNKVLSEQRANEIKKLFYHNGIQKSNIRTCIGYGKERPLNENKDEFERQLNRRVTITCYEKEFEETVLKETPKTEKTTPNEIPKKVKLSKTNLIVGNEILLENVLFLPGKHILKPISFETLFELHTLLFENPTLEIEIQGHVCCTTNEPDGYDWDEGTHNLSETRARAVYQFLIKKGIHPNRLTFKGFGGSQKINEDESTEELKSENRRVEFKILKI